MQLESLSIEELAALRDKVTQTLADKVAARQKELLAESDKLGALVTSKPSTARPKRSPKYQKGSDVWSGMGSQPAFVKQHLALGGTLDDLKVSA
ncbi:H-NS family nucleoid-associated regulatory protein [Frankia sp. RB7]|nr:H-NS family nucleoid-associated regulatory protein [Frankia sp. RB7]